MEKYFNSYFIKLDYKKLSLGINVIYQNIANHFEPFAWNFFDKIISKLKISFEMEYYKTLMLMFNKTTNTEGLTEDQKVILIDNIIKYTRSAFRKSCADC